MAEVFLSYSREDRARAEQVARGLEAAGIDVFWDNEIPPGTTWADYIEQKLGQCKALIVLWSEHSTKSQWVREEARLGRDKGVLIPAAIDKSTPPFGFGEVQAADLSQWSGAADDPNWRRFVDAVSNVARSTPRAAQNMSAPPRAQATSQPQAAWQAPAAEPKKGMPVWVWVVGAVVATIAVLAVIGSMMPDGAEQQQAAADTTTATTQQPAQPQQQQSQEGAVLLQQLQQAEMVFSQQGYQPVGQPVSGLLPNGQAWNNNVSLVAGYDYRLIGVCDQNCGDLDLALYDQNGTLVAQDQSADTRPVVGGVPSYTGNFTIQAHMFACNAPQGCYYALALYGRPAQQSSNYSKLDAILQHEHADRRRERGVRRAFGARVVDRGDQLRQALRAGAGDLFQRLPEFAFERERGAMPGNPH